MVIVPSPWIFVDPLHAWASFLGLFMFFLFAIPVIVKHQGVFASEFLEYTSQQVFPICHKCFPFTVSPTLCFWYLFVYSCCRQSLWKHLQHRHQLCPSLCGHVVFGFDAVGKNHEGGIICESRPGEFDEFWALHILLQNTEIRRIMILKVGLKGIKFHLKGFSKTFCC